MKEVKKDKQLSTKHTHKTKDRITRTPLKTGGELRCSGRVGSPCYTSGKHIVDYCNQQTMMTYFPNEAFQVRHH